MLVLPCPALHCWPKLASVMPVWVLPCALGVADTCVVSPRSPKLTLWVAGLVCPCFGSLSPPLVCTCLSHCLASLSQGFSVLLSAVLRGLSVLPKFACLPSLGTPVPAFVPLGLCALPGFICRATPGYLGLPSVLQESCVLVGLVCLLSRSSRDRHLVGATVCELLRGLEVQLSLFPAL